MQSKRFWMLAIVGLGLMLACIGCQPGDAKLVAAGIGVSDLEKSTDFYTRVMGMKVKTCLRQKDLEQVVLEFVDSKGSDVVLLHYTDDSNPNYTNNPDKLVFYVPDAYTLAAAIAAEGLRIVSPPKAQPTMGNVVVGIATDPDGYWIEMVQDPTLTVAYLGAVGIGVNDLEASADFYTRVMGMTEQYRLKIPYLMDEIILQYAHEGGGSAVVLMHYLAPKNYADLPLKLTFALNDPRATLGAIEAQGLEILVAPNGKAKFSPATYGLAKDLDGYLVEILQSVEMVPPAKR
jgi:catechol 2,3-dioxygenase-like lactoylglutathione lyase family enzyme